MKKLIFKESGDPNVPWGRLQTGLKVNCIICECESGIHGAVLITSPADLLDAIRGGAPTCSEGHELQWRAATAEDLVVLQLQDYLAAETVTQH